MTITIAVISSEEFLPRILKHTQSIDYIQLTSYTYQNPKESVALLDQIHDCDVLLFAGPLPYFFAKEKVEQKKLPAVYIPIDEYTISLSLFHTLLNVPGGLDRISIDLPKAEYIEKVADELGIIFTPWYVKDYSEIIEEGGTKFDVEEIIQFHKELWEQKQSHFALTGVDYVYRQLREMNIPSASLVSPDKNIRDAVNQAIAYGQLKISKNSQIAVGIAAIQQNDGPPVETQWQDATIILLQELLELVKETDASIQKLGLDQFIIYGTRGSIEQMIEFGKIMQVVGNVDLLAKVTVAIGFGFGLTAKEAEANARIAIYHAQKTKESSAYLVTDEKEVIGPLNTESKSFQLKSENKEVLEIAEKTGASVATITKIMQYVKLRRDNRFTASDLAEYLQISRRSSERTLKKLIEHQVVEIVGEEQPYQQGRPRAVYRLNHP
ncbi:HTH domain-containing protein [Brevibacillus sp. M2.1A]|uniref:HTH domain-containing protein n=1 Tax=Brevibacillus TaxID=55080 RepID=UPI00156AC235|nr:MULTISPECIES: HTH domain-containing protein [Brevibacillus]MCC8438463.1 HTH domain-containing protein [Brevibacillus sp. M2.1A]MCE0451485.1 HTH domain-containing protein [Brevibacillus sp. AF8]UKL00529.1 HTH domain-containing protein [Brevibacillus brevis]